MRTGRSLDSIKVFLFGLWLLSGATNLQSQENAPVADTIKGAFAAFSTDRLGNIYAVSQNQELIKFDADGRELFRYSNKTLGRLEQIDASNPFTVLLFYADQQTVILLDRTLSERTRLALSTTELGQIEHIALADDNLIWVFDEADGKLKKIDPEGNISTESDDLRQLTRFAVHPDQLLVQGNLLWLNQPDQGILVFDRRGRLESILPVKNAFIASILDKKLLVYQDNVWKIYLDEADLGTPPFTRFVITDTPHSLRVTQNRLVYLDRGQIIRLTLSH